MAFQRDGDDLNLEATELRLGLPGTTKDSEKQTLAATANCNKRSLLDMNEESAGSRTNNSNVSYNKKDDQETAPPTK